MRSMKTLFCRHVLRLARLAGLAGLALGAVALPAAATEIVYTPVNPSFGGNPLNGTVLLNSAQAQNKTKDPDALQSSFATPKTPLEQFNDILERAVLNRLATAALTGITGPNGELIVGTVTTANYIVDVQDLGDGYLTITTKDANNLADLSSFKIKKP